MRVWSLYPDTGPRHPIRTTEEGEKHLFKQMWLLPYFRGGTRDSVPICHTSWVFEWGPAMCLIARLTYRELGFPWPSHWGGCATTSSAEGSLFPLQGRPPSSSWVSWHSLESQNALQPAFWWLPELEPAVPECVEDESLVRVSGAQALHDYVPIWEGHVGSCHTEDALHKAFTSTPAHHRSPSLL